MSAVEVEQQQSLQQLFSTFVAEPTLSCLQRVVKMMYSKAAHEGFTVFDSLNRDIFAALMCITKLDNEREPIVDEIISSVNKHLEDNQPSAALLHNLLRMADKLCEASSTEELQELMDLIEIDFWSYPYTFDENDEVYVETIVHLYGN